MADRQQHATATRLLLAGLVLSLVGDVCLLSNAFFTPGLIAFLSAHVCYITLFRHDSPWMANRKALLGSLTTGVLIYAYLWNHGLPASMRIPVAAYVLVITLMAAQAISRASVLRTTTAQCVAWGAVSFMASDTTLAFNKFVSPVPASLLWILSTYYLAQWLIVHGLLQALRKSTTKT